MMVGLIIIKLILHSMEITFKFINSYLIAERKPYNNQNYWIMVQTGVHSLKGSNTIPRYRQGFPQSIMSNYTILKGEYTNN